MPDFNRDGSFNPENPESRRYRYVSGLVTYRKRYPSASPQLLVSRMVSGRNWVDMSAMFNGQDIHQWQTLTTAEEWHKARTSSSAAEVVKRAGLERQPYNQQSVFTESHDVSELLENAGWE